MKRAFNLRGRIVMVTATMSMNLNLMKLPKQLIDFVYLLIVRPRILKPGCKRVLMLETAQPAGPAIEIVAQLNGRNPRLLDLKQRYGALRHPAMSPSLWTDNYVRADLNLSAFRGDNAYLWQTRGMKETGLFSPEMKYLLTLFYTKTVDRLNLLESLKEDSLFGVFAYIFNNDLLFTRDLMDSILEISFLEEQLGISKWEGLNVLDIGAGYGRLAHRMACAFPKLKTIFCTDAVPESTFLSEFYLRFRGLEDRTCVFPLDEVEQGLSRNKIELATNIHSFSECPISAIRWWLDLVAKNGTRYLFIVPNDGDVTRSREADGSQVDFLPEVLSRGYRLKIKRPKYQDPLIHSHCLHPAYYFLFERA
jgi:hypothetical protein